LNLSSDGILNNDEICSKLFLLYAEKHTQFCDFPSGFPSFSHILINLNTIYVQNLIAKIPFTRMLVLLFSARQTDGHILVGDLHGVKEL
jgi:hypothetical protein